MSVFTMRSDCSLREIRSQQRTIIPSYFFSSIQRIICMNLGRSISYSANPRAVKESAEDLNAECRSRMMPDSRMGSMLSVVTGSPCNLAYFRHSLSWYSKEFFWLSGSSVDLRV
ncbi:hypothetical protein A2529_05010 [Candidatus Peribacteria bacterium RIFOXYD2_FULL_58_15]|nr:MAG: hypothetical protein A2529_05010 [Candidatus Peribacteria bacterium RIFOXYD2_FULL_58_15]